MKFPKVKVKRFFDRSIKILKCVIAFHIEDLKASGKSEFCGRKKTNKLIINKEKKMQEDISGYTTEGLHFKEGFLLGLIQAKKSALFDNELVLSSLKRAGVEKWTFITLEINIKSMRETINRLDLELDLTQRELKARGVIGEVSKS